MGYALMWLESLAAALLFVAAIAAGTQQVPQIRRVTGYALTGSVFVVGFFLLLYETLYSGAVTQGERVLWPLGLSAMLLLAGFLFFWIRKGNRWEALRARLDMLFGVSLPCLAALLPLALGVGVSVVTGHFRFKLGLEHSWFGYAVSWSLAFGAGACWLLLRGLRMPKDGTRPRAAEWPSLKLVLTCAAACMLNGITLWNMDGAVRTRLAALRTEAGTLALAIAPPRVPERENAAWVYEQAFAASPLYSNWPPEWQKEFSDLSAKINKQGLLNAKPGMSGMLDAHRSALHLFRRAALLPDCSFERDYVQGFSLPLPELAKLRQGARILAIDAMQQASQKDFSSALADLTALFGMARHARREPILISGLVAVAIDAMGVTMLEWVLEQGAPSAEQLASLPLDEPVSYHRIFQRLLQMEEAMTISSLAEQGEKDALSLLVQGARGFPLHYGFGGTPPRMSPFLSPVLRIFLLQDEMDGYRRLMQEFKRLAAYPFHEMQQEWKALETEHPKSGSSRVARGIVSSGMAGILSSSAVGFARGDALHRLAQAALAAARYRAKSGQLPGRLEDLVPEYLAVIPTDPFDGKPLKLKTDAEGIVFYSLGPDGKDDGGRKPADLNPLEGDLTFRLSGRAR